MTENSAEKSTEQTSEQTSGSGTEASTGIGDDQLPDDLVPGDDNPLAEGLEPGESAGDLLEEGRPVQRLEGDDDEDAAPR